MKVIGKNSLSKPISWLFFVLFCFAAFHFVYEVIGFTVCYYNYKTGNSILSDFFILGNDVGWSTNKWTEPMSDLLKFKFYYPFTKQNLLTGIFSFWDVVFFVLNSAFLTILFYSLYQFFKEISTDKVFNPLVIKWLKVFGWGNVFYSIFSVLFFGLFSGFNWNLITYAGFFILGVIILFAIEFFKKGYELQSENDLTI